MSLNEFELIENFFKHLTVPGPDVLCGIGDDCAVIKVPEGSELVVSVDTLVSGVHFFSSVNPYDLGYKSLAVNISDIAAMGARPKWVTLSITLPEIANSWLQDFTAGFSKLANKYSIALVGGDLTNGPLSVSVQIFGICDEGKSLKRNGARPGDDIYISGYLGAAAYALSTLSSEKDQNSSIHDYCHDRLLRPEPRVVLGERLVDLATSAIDISDGLASDLGHITNASEVGASIMLSRIPLHEEIKNIEDENRIWETVLCVGDDYELCFTAPESTREEISNLINDLDYPVTRIGTIESTNEVNWLLANGVKFSPKKSGYKHF
jgi:thiamine-monophosphate kinase